MRGLPQIAELSKGNSNGQALHGFRAVVLATSFSSLSQYEFEAKKRIENAAAPAVMKAFEAGASQASTSDPARSAFYSAGSATRAVFQSWKAGDSRTVASTESAGKRTSCVGCH